MSKILTPEELLNSQIEEFNRGNISFLMTLYEKDACFASKPGQVVHGSRIYTPDRYKVLLI